MNYDLQRFINAQDAHYGGYADALAEIRRGRKASHWIWYVFPQMKGLGHSYNSEYYGISGRGEAEAYLSDAVLGARLREIAGAMLAVEGRSAREILGGIDAMKVMLSMTLFDAVAPGGVFAAVLDKYYDGRRDAKTRFIRSSGVCLLIIIKIVSSSFLLKRKNINTLSINKQVVI